MSYFYNFEKLEYVRGKRPDGCILCLIRDKSEDVVNLTVWSNELFTISVNLYPYNPGHLMLFPNRHIEDIREFTPNEDAELARLTRESLNALDRTHSPGAYNIGYNMGMTAGASIRHLHLHIIPRYPREIGVADLVAGQRLLVEDPRVTQDRLRDALSGVPQ